MKVAREGQQWGEGQKTSVKRTPSSARRVALGVMQG